MAIKALEAKYEAQKIAFAPIVFQAVRSMRVLGILDFIDKNKKGVTDKEIHEALNISLYGVKVLMDLARFINVIEEKGERSFLSKIGYFLLNDELTKVNMDFTHDVCYQGMFHLDEAIKKGEPSGLNVFGEWDTIYEGLSELSPQVRKSWFGFDHFYSDESFPEALPFVFKQKPRVLFDVGGNTGKWATHCVNYDSEVEVNIFDLPGQLNTAKERLKNEKEGNRVKLHEINLLDDSCKFPFRPDAIWMSQFLDCFSEEEIISILKRSVSVMDKDSCLYIMETYWDRQSYEAAEFSLHCTSLYFTAMANGNSRMYHSKDMAKCVREAGLYIDEEVDGIGVSHTIFKCKLKPE